MRHARLLSLAALPVAFLAQCAPDACAPVPGPPPAAPNDCHPSYLGACLPIGPDIDCPDVPNPVQVVGPDEYRLDADEDGWGCELS